MEDNICSTQDMDVEDFSKDMSAAHEEVFEKNHASPSKSSKEPQNSSTEGDSTSQDNKENTNDINKQSKEKEEEEKPIYIKKLDLSLFLNEKKQIEDFTCSLCKGVLFRPVMVNLNNESKFFCEDCIIKYNSLRASSKGEEEPLQFSPVPSMVQNFLNKKHLVCKNAIAGCTWEGVYKDIEYHLSNECPKEIINCPNEGCKLKMFREEIPQHLVVCEFRIIECCDCHILLPFNILNEHQTVCKNFKVDCPQECGVKIERQNLEEHIKNECENTKVECPFSKYNCGHQQISRKEMIEKEKQYLAEHLRLIGPLYEEINKLKEENKSLKNDLGKAVHEFEKSKEERKTMKKDMEKIKEFMKVIKESSINHQESHNNNHAESQGSLLSTKRNRTPIKKTESEGKVTRQSVQVKKEPTPAQTPFYEPQAFDRIMSSKEISIEGDYAKLVSSDNKYHKFLFADISYESTVPEKVSFSIKIVSVYKWIGVGLCDKERVINNNYKFSHIPDNNHGCYLVSSNDYSWNCSNNKENNVKVEMPPISKGTTVDIEYDPRVKTLKFIWGQNTHTLSSVWPVTRGNTKLTPCVLFLYNGDSVKWIKK